MHKYEKTSVGIVGARGYAGLDLARILLAHPAASLQACFAQSSSFKLSDYLPEAAAASVPTFEMSQISQMVKALKLETLFLATPAEVSLELAPQLLALGVDVIDLSGAFRLRAEQYPEWYSLKHSSPDLLKEAHYGLVPWAGPAARTSLGGHLIANPGCYATSVLMGILPLLKNQIIQTSSLVIDSKSGTSGAGKKVAESLLFTEVEGECLPYKVGHHQHFPEICGYAQQYSQSVIDPLFTTHLLSVRRGILSSIYARLSPGQDSASVLNAFKNAYENYPLVSIEVLTDKSPPYALSLKRVTGSARTHLRFKIEGDKLYLFSLIDNLLKGAASQAIENFNRLQDLPVSTALLEKEGTL